jgi:predicted  nucleic acid-binding Zn-ribbon protein
VDITPYIGSIVTVIIAIVGGYVAMKNANNEKFSALSVQIASLSQQVTDLKEDVEKHNGVMEREYKLESDVHTAFKRIDELKDRDEKIEARIERLHEKE